MEPLNAREFLTSMKVFFSLNLPLLIQRLNNSFPNRNSKKIIYLGVTGAGKSTLFCYTKGCAIREIYVDGEQLLEIASGEGVEIGHGVDSCTVIPNIHEIYIDAPGFRDSRGTLYEVWLAFLVFYIQKYYGPLSNVFVIGIECLSELGGEGVKKLVKDMMSIYSSTDYLRQNIDTFSIIVTKTTGTEFTTVDAIRSRFFSGTYEFLRNNLHTFDPLDEPIIGGKDREGLTSLFESLQGFVPMNPYPNLSPTVLANMQIHINSIINEFKQNTRTGSLSNSDEIYEFLDFLLLLEHPTITEQVRSAKRVMARQCQTTIFEKVNAFVISTNHEEAKTLLRNCSRFRIAMNFDPNFITDLVARVQDDQDGHNSWSKFFAKVTKYTLYGIGIPLGIAAGGGIVYAGVIGTTAVASAIGATSLGALGTAGVTGLGAAGVAGLKNFITGKKEEFYEL